MSWSKCDTSATSQESETFTQSSTSANDQQVGEESTGDGNVTFISSVDALGNNTINMVNNTTLPLIMSCVTNFSTTITNVLGALTTQCLREDSLIVGNTLVLSPQITIGGYVESVITIELPKPIRVNIIISRVNATVFNIIYRRIF